MVAENLCFPWPCERAGFHHERLREYPNASFQSTISAPRLQIWLHRAAPSAHAGARSARCRISLPVRLSPARSLRDRLRSPSGDFFAADLSKDTSSARSFLPASCAREDRSRVVRLRGADFCSPEFVPGIEPCLLA